MLALAIVFAVPLCAIEAEHACERAHTQCMSDARVMMETGDDQLKAAQHFANCLPTLNKCIAECPKK